MRRQKHDTIDDLDSRTSDIAENKTPRVYVGGIGYYGAHGLLSTEPAYPPFLFYLFMPTILPAS